MEIHSRSLEIIAPERSSSVRAVASKLESAFVAEMLKVMEPASETTQFGGGIGEQQFKSFLLDLRAESIVEKGGLGLVDDFVKSLEKE